MKSGTKKQAKYCGFLSRSERSLDERDEALQLENFLALQSLSIALSQLTS